MESFFEIAINLVKSDVGIIVIVVLFVLLMGLKLLIVKSKKLNQKQTFSFLNILWGGFLLLLLILIILNIYPSKGSSINDSIIDNNDSNITINVSGASVEINKSIKSNSNSSIHISL